MSNKKKRIHTHTSLHTRTHTLRYWHTLATNPIYAGRKKIMRPNYACKRCLSLSFRYTNIYIIYADLWRDKGEGRKRERCRARASHHLSAASLIYLHFLYICRNDWYASWGVIQLSVKLLNKTLVWQNICKQIKEQVQICLRTSIINIIFIFPLITMLRQAL